VEGFFETVAVEVAQFGIDITIVEPGAVPTGFLGSGLMLAAPMDAYSSGPVADARRFVAQGGSAQSGGGSDLGAVADAIIDSTKGPALEQPACGADRSTRRGVQHRRSSSAPPIVTARQRARSSTGTALAPDEGCGALGDGVDDRISGSRRVTA
jgi:hypothetical protein